MCLHLFHHITAMHLNGDFADTDIRSDLLAETPVYNMNHNLAFAGRKSFEPGLETRDVLFVFQPRTIECDSTGDRVEKFLVAERFCQEVDSAPFHRFD